MIKKILKTYRGLPREIQMFVAMAGLASPIGVIYLLQRWVFRGWPLILVIAVVAGGLALLALIGWLIAKLFGIGGAKRTKRMANELARDDAPASVDVRAKIKANNEKFFTHIREMKKSINVSVYDLPWYIVIGDSGCGKTKLVNNGGLQFSMGRPEGYQLGTLDYNWWFSDDAVFIDMAGRLCNPQEAQDHREWQAFLNTIAKGRKGFPINGTVLCISADHLLQDSPEKHEADANIALERLREMQSRLGVTFATYLVITKCDKILGFMQFFDRAVRDLKVKNQIFGWSKPGEFNELYDPEAFNDDFESLYFRLNELRMRRLNDEGVDEIDRGLAYSFPEEFRELREPLQTYLRTVFAPIKHSGAIKNLIFRGIYYTSATQEGELILKHLSERLGSEAASQFPTLDSLYPEKRPLFVKDVLFQKMFPENGLVFRHEGDVVRNRRLARLLTIASVALAIGLGTALFFSSRALNRKLNDPRIDASESTKPQYVAQFVHSPDDALEHVGKLSSDINSLEEGLGAAAIFLLAWDADEPVRNLRTIRARLFEDAVLKRALDDIGTQLRSEIVWSGAPGDLAQVDQTVSARIDALEAYVQWYGCRKRSSVPDGTNYEGLETMSRIVTGGDSVILKDSYENEAKQYFLVVKDPDADWTKNPARFLDDGARQTIQEAVRRLHRYYLDRYAMLDDSASAILGEWMRISRLCATIEENYRRIVARNPSDITTPEQLDAFTADFFSSHDRFKEAMGQVAGDLAVEKMTALEDALLELRGHWTDFDERMKNAYATCGEGDGASVIPSLAIGNPSLDLVSLDQVLWTRMFELRFANVDWDVRYREYFGDRTNFDKVVDEVFKVYDYLIDYTPGDDIRRVRPRLELTGSAQTVRAVLQRIRDSLPERSSVKGARNLEEWAVALQTALTSTQGPTDGVRIPPDLAEAWRPGDLAALDGGFLKVNRLIVTQLQLTQLLDQLEGLGEWSLAELYADYDRMSQSAYAVPKPSGRQEAPVAVAKTEETAAPEAEQEKQRGVALPSLFKDDEPKTPTRPTTPAVTEEVETKLTSAIPQCASPDFMTRVAFQWVQLVYMLEAFRESDYLAMGGAGQPLHQQCAAELRRQWRRYVETYATSWRQAYENKSLAGLAELQRPSDWESFASQFATSNRGIMSWQDTRADLEASLKELLRATRWATYHQGQGGFWEDVGSRQIRPLVEELVRDVDNAIGSSGPRGSFVRTARADGVAGVPEDGQPWDNLARAFGLGLSRLTVAVGECTNLEKQLELSVTGSRMPEIPWGEIAALRENARLNDELMTNRLVELESHGLDLLNRKLTAMLSRVQEDALGTFAAAGGWPYAGSGSLATVDFQAFKKFLAQVRQFKAVFEKLDESIARQRPNDASLRNRLKFYSQCQQWYDFLGLKGGVNDLLSATPLQVVVQGDDPIGDSVFAGQVTDTAQHFYKRAVLDIGGETLELDTTKTEYSAKTMTWDWDRQGGVSMKATLKEPTRAGYPEELMVPIGQSSPLAFCAYLRQYANGSGTNWRTLAKFNTDGIDRAQGPFLGAMFVFQLNRAMPEPIEKLQG